jgi:undecaprenyl-diphosphatase
LEPLQAIVLALVQGLTEILPISSSGHLILVPWAFGWTDQGLAFDVAVHVGTLAAVIAYFRGDVVVYWHAFWRSLARRALDAEGKVAWALAIGTVPAAIAGLLLEDLVAGALRSPRTVAVTTIGYGVLLLAADRFGAKRRDERSITLRDGILIGVAQALALVPGTSRSGITMTAGLALGLDRTGAARFAFLLAIPVIAAAGLLEGVSLARSAEPVAWAELALGMSVAGAAAFACIHYFLRFIQRIGMWPFVLYRFALGAVLWFALA